MDQKIGQMDQKISRMDQKIEQMDKKIDDNFNELKQDNINLKKELREEFKQENVKLKEDLRKELKKEISKHMFLFEQEYGRKLTIAYEDLTYRINRKDTQSEQIANLEKKAELNTAYIYSLQDRVDKLENVQL
jgi:hypothetical protein